MTDVEFLQAFEAAAIPSEQWTHRDHIRMAWLYLRADSFDVALDRIRRGIRALNAANGVEQTAEQGYHETVTVAWARVIASTIEHHGAAAGDFAAFEEANPHLSTRTLLRLYYTRARILSADARQRFVPPDVAPLPGGS